MIDNKLVIVIDFDHTISNGLFPEVGPMVLNADKIIKQLYSEGHFIIINTCRSGRYEGMAEDFLIENEIPFHYINCNHPRLIELFKQDCRKISGDVYIDDKNIGGLPPWNDIYDMLQKLHTNLLIAQG